MFYPGLDSGWDLGFGLKSLVGLGLDLIKFWIGVWIGARNWVWIWGLALQCGPRLWVWVWIRVWVWILHLALDFDLGLDFF